MLSTQVEWPENTEILLADMPPSTASKVFSFFDNMSALLGCIIVTQPSETSALGMRDTVYNSETAGGSHNRNHEAGQ